MRSKLLFIANDFDIVIYRFRREVIESFAAKEYEIVLVTPYSKKAEDFCKSLGVKYINVDIDRRGKNPFKDLLLLFNYFKIIKKEKPDYIFSYTIKPNLYVGLVNLFFRKKFYPNVTGLGSVFANHSIVQKFIISLYKLSFKSTTKVFFQNEQNKKLFIAKKIISGEKSILLPGSGVNLDENKYVDYPKDQGILKFVFLGRIMKEKGIYELLETFLILEKKYKNIYLDIYGFCEGNNFKFLNAIENSKRVKYHGFTDESKRIVSERHAIIQPSYAGYEGLSNSLLEAAAIGRAVITTNVCGCREIVDDGASGYLAEQKNVDSLVCALEKFINLSYEEKIGMGINAHKRVEENFDRKIVVKNYIGVIS
ncbi:glycosyltransferase family 4 protein [Francisella tularensis]|uniref:glycosyltransferase family 4 protein n=1 Tax=Francisella tularensis TaxID=263 RepID=UPI0008F52EE8|nr:glycosyltransferase family 4 protein [Francisella tularensis]APA83605.1 Lipid carrier: UDP-N-acetylgalactosaminyltransferase / Alpha-1,3-N-acetylgalactosamine transferase PglA [Francisella tularensis subsp. novicida PA10-7858]